MMNRVSLWHNHSHMFWNFLMHGQCSRLSLKTFILVLSLISPPPILMPLSLIPFFLPLLAFQRHFDLPPSLSFAGPLHLSPSPLLLGPFTIRTLLF